MNQGGAPAAPPVWRGLLHQISAFVFAPLFVFVLFLARTAGQRLAVVVYGLGVLLMFAISALYHRGRWSPVARRRLMRLDHSTILLAIAGSYTAIAGLSLGGDTRIVVLTTAWAGAAVGIVIRMLWLDAPRSLTTAVYVAVGWVAALAFPALYHALGTPAFTLVIIGGGCYSLGAVVYARKRPDPAPATFGYHEVFHALVCAGALCHLVAVATLLLDQK
jgi:hemolysin III